MAATVAMMLLIAIPVSAAPATTFTETVQGVTESFIDTLPCGGAPHSITITYNAVFHITTKDDTMHVTGTQAGSFTATPVSGTGPTFTGHFAIWFGANLNDQSANGTFTFNVSGHGSDGSNFHQGVVAHFNVTPQGTVNEFFKLNCP
jgi:hypothetical protein